MIPTRLLLILVTCLLTIGFAGCNREAPSPQASASASAKPPELPRLTIKDDSKQLLLTWVDENGDFHVVQKTKDVPETGRKQVRVVDSASQAGTVDWVYVANLTEKKPDGTYAITTMSREKWDEIGAKRRKSRLEALAPKQPSAAPPASANASAAPHRKAADGAQVSAIVYGADWCQPCHAAEAYLKQRGVNVVKKDIDNSDAARAEMQKKLERAGMGGAQIPIIDVMGQLLVGYSPAALDRAIQSARPATTL